MRAISGGWSEESTISSNSCWVSSLSLDYKYYLGLGLELSTHLKLEVLLDWVLDTVGDAHIVVLDLG
jgi:hypothetical protein